MNSAQDANNVTQGTAEEIVPADDFSDVESLSEEDISLQPPKRPTREDVRKLLTVYNDRYTDQLVLFHGNYNSKPNCDINRYKI